MAQHSSGGGLGGIVKIGLIGGAAYFGYNYLVNSGLWAEWFGGSAAAAIPPATVPINTPASSSTTPPASSSTTPPAATAPPPATTVQSVGSALGQALNAAAIQYLGNMIAAGTPAPGGGLTVDQWAYYYGQIRGLTLSASQVESLIQAAGLTDATRSTIISLATFLGALGSVGLSGYRGVGAVPVLARASWGARTPARALPPNYVRRGAPMIRRR
jgi:hypothetical protein